MTIAVRRLAEADAAAYHAIRLDGLRTAPEAFGGSYDDEVATPIGAVATGLVRNIVFGVASETGSAGTDGRGGTDGALAGVAGMYVRPAARLAHKAVLFGMYVRPDARRRGVAAALLAAILAAARTRVEEIQLSVVASNVAARALYRAAGFRPYGFERCALKVDGYCP